MPGNLYRQLRTLLLSRHGEAMASLLAAVLTVLCDSFFRLNDIHALFWLLPHVGQAKFYGALILAFLQTAAIFYVIAQFPRIARLILIPVMGLVVMVQMSYFLTLGHYMFSDDLSTAITLGMDYTREAVVSFFNPMVILYAIPSLLGASILLVVPYRFRLARQLGVTSMATLFLIVSNYAFFVKAQEQYFHLNPLASLIRTALYSQFQAMLDYRGPRDELPELAANGKPADSIIYIIDESIRGSNLSLNGYSRLTTPFLQSLEADGRLKNLGIGVAASTYSSITNAYLISGHNVFPDKELRTAKNPTLFDYAGKMGYRTVFIDVNESYLTSRARENKENSIRAVDLWMTVESFRARGLETGANTDITVARFIADLLNHSGGYFIIVNKKGLHYSYRNKFPDEPAYRIWEPMMELNEAIATSAPGREKLVNTYDNGVRFVVDKFFQELVGTIKNQNYMILYTSDHGQTLSENGQIYTHAQPDEVIVDVPAFFIVGQRYEKAKMISAIAKGIRVSHLNNFATLLDLMAAPRSWRMHSYDKSIFHLTPEDNQTRFYLSGSLHGWGGNYVIGKIPTPPPRGWGASQPVARARIFN